MSNAALADLAMTWCSYPTESRAPPPSSLSPIKTRSAPGGRRSAPLRRWSLGRCPRHNGLPGEVRLRVSRRLGRIFPAYDPSMVLSSARDKLATGEEASPLIGRGVELEQVLQALWAPESRLVTLTGPPGVGKTMLARAATDAAADR